MKLKHSKYVNSFSSNMKQYNNWVICFNYNTYCYTAHVSRYICYLFCCLSRAKLLIVLRYLSQSREKYASADARRVKTLSKPTCSRNTHLTMTVMWEQEIYDSIEINDLIKCRVIMIYNLFLYKITILTKY